MTTRVDDSLAGSYRVLASAPSPGAAPRVLYTPSAIRRLAGHVLDQATAFAVAFLASVAVMAAYNGGLIRDGSPALGLPVAASLAVGLIQAVLTGVTGRSLGKMICGLRVVRTDGAACGFFRGGVLRNLAVPLAAVALARPLCAVDESGLVASLAVLALVVVDALMVFGEHGRRIGDRLADTRVVDESLADLAVP